MLKHQHGGDIYSIACRMDYSANINPLGTPASVIAAAQEAVLQSANYPDVEYRKLRAAIAEKDGVRPEQIICGNGAAELIFAVAQAIKPKKAVLAAPGFAEYEQALRACGCEVIFYELKEETGFVFGDDYHELLTADVDLLFLCNPNNPTGVLLDPGWLEETLRLARSQKILVVLDVCFLDFLADREKADYARRLEEFPNLFLLKAFTKTYAMAGLRLGYGLTANLELLNRMREVVQPWSVSIPAQAAGVAALQEREFVEQTRKLIAGEREWLLEQLPKLGLKTFDASANFIFFRGPETLGERCKANGVLLRDCSNYRGLTKGFYRIAVRTRPENEELIRTMRDALGYGENGFSEKREKHCQLRAGCAGRKENGFSEKERSIAN